MEVRLESGLYKGGNQANCYGEDKLRHCLHRKTPHIRASQLATRTPQHTNATANSLAPKHYVLVPLHGEGAMPSYKKSKEVVGHKNNKFYTT